MLGLHQRPGHSTHRVGGPGQRPDLLFFPTRSGSELRPGTEADGPAAGDATHNPKHTAATHAEHTTARVEPSPAHVTRYAFTDSQPETVTVARIASLCEALRAGN